MRKSIVNLPSGIRRRKARSGFVETAKEMLKTVCLLHQFYRVCLALVKFLLQYIDHF